MSLINRPLLAGLLLIVINISLASTDIQDIDNYRQYSPQFSSSGQPSAEWLAAVSEAGFKRVVYIAYTDNHTAIDHEDRVVNSLGMDYIHIPVDVP